jgi:predicted ester cyclase
MRHALLLFAASSIALVPAAAGTAEKNAYRTLINECLNKGDMAAADMYIAKDMVDHDPNNPMGGLDGFKKFVTEWKSAFPDGLTEIQDIVSEGDRVIARIRATGTQTGKFNEMQATNKRIDVLGFDEARFKDGKIVEHWSVVDRLELMKQLGIVSGTPGRPQPSSTPAPAKPQAPAPRKF